ncbi:hypothetical protein RJ641_033187 [Dillenia turbinata]|uniref:HhH-GPD domain-containing protein n=1 Tax=Dillenia turbinata TaxID=194707 RepID=A0AAN8VUR7_9MAGN
MEVSNENIFKTQSCWIPSTPAETVPARRQPQRQNQECCQFDWNTNPSDLEGEELCCPCSSSKYIGTRKFNVDSLDSNAAVRAGWKSVSLAELLGASSPASAPSTLTAAQHSAVGKSPVRNESGLGSNAKDDMETREQGGKNGVANSHIGRNETHSVPSEESARAPSTPFPTQKQNARSTPTNSDQNKKPRQKVRRKIHRPKILIEDRHKRPPKKPPVTPCRSVPKERPEGKRKYVRKSNSKPLTTPAQDVLEAAVSLDVEVAAKACKRKLNFDPGIKPQEESMVPVVDGENNPRIDLENYQQDKRAAPVVFHQYHRRKRHAAKSSSLKMWSANATSEVQVLHAGDDNDLKSRSNLQHNGSNECTVQDIANKACAIASCTQREGILVQLPTVIVKSKEDDAMMEATPSQIMQEGYTTVNQNHDGQSLNVLSQETACGKENTLELMSQIGTKLLNGHSSPKSQNTALEQNKLCFTNQTGCFYNRLEAYEKKFQELRRPRTSRKAGRCWRLFFPERCKKRRTRRNPNVADAFWFTLATDNNKRKVMGSAIKTKSLNLSSAPQHTRGKLHSGFNNDDRQGQTEFASTNFQMGKSSMERQLLMQPSNCLQTLRHFSRIEIKTKKRSIRSTRWRSRTSLAALPICNRLPPPRRFLERQALEVFHVPQTCSDMLVASDHDETMTTSQREMGPFRKIVDFDHTMRAGLQQMGEDHLAPTMVMDTTNHDKEMIKSQSEMGTFPRIVESNHSKKAGSRKKHKDNVALTDLRGLNVMLPMEIIDIIQRLEYLTINDGGGELILLNQNKQNTLVPYEGPFDPTKKKQPLPKVVLDQDTIREWNLLMGIESDEGVEQETSKEKVQWWKEERAVFRGRVDSFIARMHLILGDRRFSPWKGSVLDSVVGVFLTQNVSDHLSSSAFMSLAARFPLRSTPKQACCEDEELPNSQESSGSNEGAVRQACDGSSIAENGERIVNVVNISTHMKSTRTDTRSTTLAEAEYIKTKDMTPLQTSHGIETYTDSDPESHQKASFEPSRVESSTTLTGPLHFEESTLLQEFYEQLSCDQKEETVKSEPKKSPVHKPPSCIDSDLKDQKTRAEREQTGSSETPTSEMSTSKCKKGKNDKTEEEKINWDNLRTTYSARSNQERSSDTMDSVDWEAVRRADVNEVAKAILERGMNNVLAARIKDFLDRLAKEHGELDLEWLRDVPSDKVKDFLLSIRGLGLKSVECVRLLTLRHLAFPVDTNVGRIAVRLGWVPLEPLPEQLQIHLLEQYPLMDSIQKYLWPRFCTIDRRILYELHYQMITFGKVFCTKRQPNCNVCPMRGDCRHFASAFASARLALPGPQEKSIVGSTAPVVAMEEPVILPLPETNMYPESRSTNTCEPIIEEPASPEPMQPEKDERDIEDFDYEDSDGIPTIKLNIEEFKENLQNFMEKFVEEGEVSKALVAITSEAVSIPTPALKYVSRLRTEHQVYELPDSHPLLKDLEPRQPDDPCPYLLAIWATTGEPSTLSSPAKESCHCGELEELCTDKMCPQNNIQNENSIPGTILSQPAVYRFSLHSEHLYKHLSELQQP